MSIEKFTIPIEGLRAGDFFYFLGIFRNFGILSECVKTSCYDTDLFSLYKTQAEAD